MAKILVVDDSSTVREEVASFLRKGGLDVAAAVDGKDGLTKLQADPGIRLVVADVNMPNMDGLTMVEKIRSELGNTTRQPHHADHREQPEHEGARQGRRASRVGSSSPSKARLCSRHSRSWSRNGDLFVERFNT